MPKVLLIEDRRENIVFIANNVLKPMGYDVITAMDGLTGMKKASEQEPDLIITDLKLPKMHGLEVMENLQKKGVFIPTIVMTFHGTEETAVKALRLGARDYLIKPFTIEEVQEALDRVFEPRPVSPESYLQKLKDQSTIKSLEEKVEELSAQLREKDNLLQNAQRQTANSVNKMDMAVIAQRAAAWEEDNARLNKILAQAKYAVSKSEGRAKALEDGLAAQRAQTGKYKMEVMRLARELRNLSEAMRLMSQDMEQQMHRLAVLTPGEKN